MAQTQAAHLPARETAASPAVRPLRQPLADGNIHRPKARRAASRAPPSAPYSGDAWLRRDVAAPARGCGWTPTEYGHKGNVTPAAGSVRSGPGAVGSDSACRQFTKPRRRAPKPAIYPGPPNAWRCVWLRAWPGGFRWRQAHPAGARRRRFSRDAYSVVLPSKCSSFSSALVGCSTPSRCSGGPYSVYSRSGALPVFTTLCRAPAGTITASSSSTSY